MKRKFLSAVVIIGALFLTACQQDDTMDELILDTDIEAVDGSSDGAGGSGSQGHGGGGVGSN